MKTTKTEREAMKIAKTLPAGLKTEDDFIKAMGGLNPTVKTDAIVNAYRQRDADDLAGPPAPKAAKPAPKAAKPAPKAKAKGKRVGKDGKVIVAYPMPQGRTAVMFAAVLAGASNEEGLAVIHKQFGKNVPSTTASLGWVRSQLRNNAARWTKNESYGATSKLARGVKANKDCAKMNVKLFNELMAAREDESDE